MIRRAIVAVQVLTYAPLAWLFLRDGEPRLALAQALLGVVTLAVYL